MIGSLATVVLPDGEHTTQSPTQVDALEASLSADYGIDVPVFDFPEKPQRLLRISAQIYNTEEEYVWLVAALQALLIQK